MKAVKLLDVNVYNLEFSIHKDNLGQRIYATLSLQKIIAKPRTIINQIHTSQIPRLFNFNEQQRTFKSPSIRTSWKQVTCLTNLNCKWDQTRSEVQIAFSMVKIIYYGRLCGWSTSVICVGSKLTTSHTRHTLHVNKDSVEWKFEKNELFPWRRRKSKRSSAERAGRGNDEFEKKLEGRT